MTESESKNEKFRRLARLRGERALKDIRLLANLANRNNYSYSEDEVRALFSPLEAELRLAKQKFRRTESRGINL